MKKSVILAAMLTLLAATGSMAENKASEHAASGHKLLVTDVPDPGQIEARIDYAYSNAEGKNDLDEKTKEQKSSASVTLATGLVKGLKVSASIPYTFMEHQESTKIDGVGDLTLGAKYSITKGLAHLPVDLAVGADWQLNSASTSAGKPGSGANVYSPYVAVSKALGMTIPYAKYQADYVVKDGQGHTNHNLTIGAEIELTHKLSLDASLKATRNASQAGLKSSNDVEVELMPYISVCKNTYLLPRVAYKFVGDVEDNAGLKLVKDKSEYKAGLGLYVLF